MRIPWARNEKLTHGVKDAARVANLVGRQRVASKDGVLVNGAGGVEVSQAAQLLERERPENVSTRW